MITAFEAHVEGEPIRLVTGGIPNIPGKTMVEKTEFARQNLDYLRTALNYEPRGHADMFTCILTPPVSHESAFGILFASQLGYGNMCGHALIGISTILVEMGLVEPKEPVTEIAFDTPVGTVRARVNVARGRAKNVTFQGAPSFLYKSIVTDIPGLGRLPVDIAFGGNFFAIVEAKDIELKLRANDILAATGILTQIKESVEKQVAIQHPELDFIEGIRVILLNDKPNNPNANMLNIAVASNGTSLSRSPCGTGTCAEMAALYTKGQLSLGETFVTESLIGSLFYGKLIKEVSVGGLEAVLPEVTGSAFVTGVHNFLLDEDDPFKYGFVVP
jgi:proline racemase